MGLYEHHISFYRGHKVILSVHFEKRVYAFRVEGPWCNAPDRVTYMHDWEAHGEACKAIDAELGIPK